MAGEEIPVTYRFGGRIALRQKKGWSETPSFFHTLLHIPYFFLVVFVAFVAVFFVVPHAAPFDLQAMINLLYKNIF